MADEDDLASVKHSAGAASPVEVDDEPEYEKVILRGARAEED